MKLCIKMYSEKKNHGLTREERAVPVKGKTALVHRAKKNLSTPVVSGNSPGKDDPPRSRDYVPKPYGTHDGSIHVDILAKMEGPLDEILKFLTQHVDPAVSYFQNIESIDIQGKKAAYSDAVDKCLKGNYSEGDIVFKVSEVDKVRRANAFKYVRTQIVVMVYDDEPFTGSRPSDRGDHEMVLLSKTVYSDGLLVNDLKTIKMIIARPEEAQKIKIVKPARAKRIIVTKKGFLAVRPATEEELQEFKELADL